MEMRCRRCGVSLAPGTPRYPDQVVRPNGDLLCADCDLAERAHVDRRPDQRVVAAAALAGLEVMQ